MSKKHNGVNYAKSPAHTDKRKSALARLRAQLKLGKKTLKHSLTNNRVVELTEQDIKRINREIAILESRV